MLQLMTHTLLSTLDDNYNKITIRNKEVTINTCSVLSLIGYRYYHMLCLLGKQYISWEFKKIFKA